MESKTGPDKNDLEFSILDNDAERGLIGIFLSGAKREFLLQCCDMLEPDDFSDQWCADAWTVLKQLAKERSFGDLTNFMAKARQMGVKSLTPISVTEAACNGSMFGYPIEIAAYIADLATRRRMTNTLIKQINNVREIDIPVEAILGDLKALINNTASKAASDVRNYDVMKDTIHHWEQRIRGEQDMGLMTGLHYIDTRGGMQLSDLNIIAGRTSNGKTSLAICIALNVAEQNNPVGIFSLEMSFEQLFTRMTAIRSGVSASRLQYTKLEQDDFDNAFLAACRIGELPIYYDGTRSSNINQIEVSIRRMKLNHDIRLAVVDYAQLLTNPGTKDRRDIVGGAADTLKRIAVELNICIILISQLRRASNYESPVPSIAQLKESGNLENAADNIYLIYRAELNNVNYPDLSQQWSRYDTAGTALIINGKSRNHSIGEFLLGFDGERTRFYELSTPPLMPAANANPDNNIEPRHKNAPPPF